MKNIFISKPTNQNPKFINFLSITNNSVVNNNNIKIYEYLYHNIKTFVIHESNVDNILLSFMEDNIDKIKVIIYLDNIPQGLLNHPNVTYISRVNMNNENILNISKFTIKELFENRISANKTKSNIACFIDHVSEIDNELTDIIQQITKDHKNKIRLFNNSQIHHVHNVGLLSEKDKANVLLTHEYFLDNDSEYIDEAIISRCKIIARPYSPKIEDLNCNINEDFLNTYEDISTFNEKFCI